MEKKTIFYSNPVIHVINEDGSTAWTLPLSTDSSGEMYHQIEESESGTLILGGKNGLSDAGGGWAALIEVFPPATSVTTSLQQDLTILPNPFQDVLTVQSGDPIHRLTLMDLKGKILREASANQLTDCASLPPGMYLLTVETTNEKVVTKVVKGR